MSGRTEWTDPDNVGITITDDHRDSHGTGLDRGNVAIVISQDAECLCIEGTDLAHLRVFLDRLDAALMRAEAKAEGVL